MRLSKLFFAERYLRKVAGTYRTELAARQAAASVIGAAHLTGKQVQIVTPHDPDWGRKVEPEGVGIWRTAIRSHITLGLLGLAAGAALFGVLLLSGNAAIAASPILAFLVIASFGGIFGLMLGGLVTIRPDHNAVIGEVREASREGRWSVVVHAASADEEREAIRALNPTTSAIVSTL